MGGAMSIVLAGSTSGTITLQEPAVAGTNTLNLPAATGTVALTSQLPVSGPAFSVYKVTTDQTITTDTFTKITLNAEEFDTNNCFDSTTNYRFTPTIAGYYQFSGAAYISSTSTLTQVLSAIYKNGSAVKNGNYVNATLSSPQIAVISALIYLNGTTDYVELWGYASGGGTLKILASQVSTYFQGFLARAA
jgi:hypothetical protein